MDRKDKYKEIRRYAIDLKNLADAYAAGVPVFAMLTVSILVGSALLQDDEKRRTVAMEDQKNQVWGWASVEPRAMKFVDLKNTLDEFTATISRRGYPDEYVCTEDVWRRIRETANLAHKKGIGNTELVNVCGVPVKTFETVAECNDYAAAIKITLNRRVHVIR